jgi:hypothetical protein
MIQVELWGGGGGATGSQSGGSGGYNRSQIEVTPGQTYSIIVGQGGPAGSGTSNGANGGFSSFHSILSASGGGGGLYSVFGGTGTNGAVINWPYTSYPSYYAGGVPIGQAPGGTSGTIYTGGAGGFCLISY